MGLALAAELNGYPGPRHVLDMADAMHLSDDQRATVDRLFSAMKTETVALGERLIAQETHLDRLFADKRIPGNAHGDDPRNRRHPGRAEGGAPQVSFADA